MSTSRMQVVANADAGMKQKRVAAVPSAPVRIRRKTKAKLEHLLRQANKDRVGRKVKVDDLISFSLGLITADHVIEICSKTLSNKDRVELMYRKLSKERRGTTREEFLGMLLDGKLPPSCPTME